MGETLLLKPVGDVSLRAFSCGHLQRLLHGPLEPGEHGGPTGPVDPWESPNSSTPTQLPGALQGSTRTGPPSPPDGSCSHA